MNYLLIQNIGNAPVEGYTLLGMTTTRDCGVAGTSGQFGSGAKHAINVLLRAGMKFWIYCGKNRLEFYTKDVTVNDGLVEKAVRRVMCRLSGPTSNRVIDCGWVLDFGAIDWNETSMALREFVSNAIDRTIRQEGGFVEPIKNGNLAVIPQTEDQRRAKDGYTRIYVEMTPEVQKYFGELPKRFLHFSSNPGQVAQGLLLKADRNLGNGLTPMIYRCGILVREISETKDPSLFDYNFEPSELSIDECRNSSEYSTRAECARKLRKASADVLTVVYASLIQGAQTFESNLDQHYLCPSWDTPQEEEKKNWQEGWEQASEGAVLCDEEATQTVKFVQRKGHKAQTVKASAWVGAAEQFGVKTATAILDAGEQKGRETIPASHAAIKAVDIAWSWMEQLEMTQGKDKPLVACYRDIMSAESSVMGYQADGMVYLREDISDAVTKFTLKVAYEEVVHYITGATDNSRDFQNFLIDCFIEAVA
jgi:hypothetical protein